MEVLSPEFRLEPVLQHRSLLPARALAHVLGHVPAAADVAPLEPEAQGTVVACDPFRLGNQGSRNPESFRERMGCWSLRRAPDSICRTRSRVIEKIRPTWSRVCA